MRVPNKPSFSKPAGLRSPASCLHNADQRNRRLIANFIKHHVRRVGGEKSEICSRSRKFLDFADQILGHLDAFVRLGHVSQLLQIDAVDDH